MTVTEERRPEIMAGLGPRREEAAPATKAKAVRHPRSRTSTRALFAGASAVRKQLADTDGVIGFSLLARPVRKQYATLSVWEDEAALANFARSEPHAQLMVDLGPDGADDLCPLEGARRRRSTVVE